MGPTEAEYKAAKKVIAEYEAENERIVNERLQDLKKDLDKYFKETYIKKWRFGDIDHQNFMVELIPEKPEFDESYGDDEMDKQIKDIGMKHGLTVFWTSDIYGK